MTAVGAGLVLAWAAHDAEELLTMAPTSQAVLSALPSTLPIPPHLREDGLSQRHVNLAIGLMALPVAAAAIRGMCTGGRSRWFRGAVRAFGAHGITHIGSSLAASRYTTGVVTAPLIVLPYWARARRALLRHGLDGIDPATAVKALSIVPITVGAHVAAAMILRGEHQR